MGTAPTMRVPLELLAIIGSSLGSSVVEDVPPASVAPTRGNLQSDNYPNNYENNVDQNYTIQVRTGKVIKIKFTDMEIERPKNRYCKSDIKLPRCCPYDSIKIMDPQSGRVLLRPLWHRPSPCGLQPLPTSPCHLQD